MYPSGVWRGFWEQPAFGRQAMTDFRLRFHEGTVTGSGVDVIGEFVFRGVFDLKTGEIRMVKQYPKDFELVFGPENVREIYQKGKIACSIGLEGLHQAGNSISVIRAYHQLGVRYVSRLIVLGNRVTDEV